MVIDKVNKSPDSQARTKLMLEPICWLPDQASVEPLSLDPSLRFNTARPLIHAREGLV